MAILQDCDLWWMGPTLIHPFDPEMIQPASIDLHINNTFYLGRVNHLDHIDPSVCNDNRFGPLVTVPEGEAFYIPAGGFALASTYERVKIPTDLVARFEGKSSLGRLGLLTHITAGFIDPGFHGSITLELKNITGMMWKIIPGMKIGQICFEELTGHVRKPYGNLPKGSHYQDQTGVTLSRSHINFSKVNVYEKEN